MGRYEYYVTEEGPSLTKPAEEFDYVTYRECIEFLDHLIKRGRVLVDKKVRGLFRIFDVTEHDMKDSTKNIQRAETNRKQRKNWLKKRKPDLKDLFCQVKARILTKNMKVHGKRKALMIKSCWNTEKNARMSSWTCSKNI